MSEGGRIRLGRIFRQHWRATVPPVDHGPNLGRVAGAGEPWSLIREARRVGCDGVLLSMGVAKVAAGDCCTRDSPARLVALDAFQKRSADDRGSSALVSTVAAASRLAFDDR